MTARELRLRTRIDLLSDELAERRAEIDRLKTTRQRRLNRCAYCGDWTYGVACFAHSDLLLCDPGAPKA